MVGVDVDRFWRQAGFGHFVQSGDRSHPQRNDPFPMVPFRPFRPPQVTYHGGPVNAQLTGDAPPGSVQRMKLQDRLVNCHLEFVRHGSVLHKRDL
jgi:hypothetical protein